MIEVSEQANKTAQLILNELGDRRGISEVLDSIDDEIIKEIQNAIAAIIDNQYPIV